MVAIAIITRFGLGRIANGRVAQLAEHTPEKRGVTGSTPVSTTICVARMRTVLLRVVAKSYLFKTMCKTIQLFMYVCKTLLMYRYAAWSFRFWTTLEYSSGSSLEQRSLLGGSTRR